MTNTLKVNIRQTLITKDNGYRAGCTYDVERAIALDLCKAGFAELVPQERAIEQAVAKPIKSKRGR